MGGDYLVVTDNFEFEIPEYWRGKVAIDLAPPSEDYPYMPSSRVDDLRIKCTAPGMAAEDSNWMYYVSVIPIKDFKAGTYSGKDMIMASCEATTDAYAVVFAMEDYFMHYDMSPDSYVQVITGGAMNGTSSEKGSQPQDMLRAANEYLRDNVIGSLVVKDAAGKLVAPKTAFPLLENTAA